MAMRWPGTIPSGARCSEPVTLLDLMPTFASLAGAPLPSDREIDGIDLLPMIKGEQREPLNRTLFWRTLHQKAVRRGNWKLFADHRQGLTHLYDLSSDKEERRDLSSEHPDKVKELEAALAHWERQMAPPSWPYVMYYRTAVGGEEYLFAL